MGQVVDLWMSEIRDSLRRSGSVVRPVGGLDVDRWRWATRQAGRSLGWSVRTGVSDDGSTVWATALDFQPTEADQAAATRAIGALLYERP